MNGFLTLRRLFVVGFVLLSVSLVVLPRGSGFTIAQTQQCSPSDLTLITGEVTAEPWAAGLPNMANQTIHFQHSQSNPGTMGFSLARGGPFTDSLNAPMTLDSNGNGSLTIYIKGLTAGQTTRTTCLVELSDCAWVEHWTVKGCACPPIIPR